MGVIEGMAELGLLGAPIPTEYGGAGLDFISEASDLRGDRARRGRLPHADQVHVGLNSLALLRYASEEQKQRWLVPQATRREARLLRPDRAGAPAPTWRR